MKRIYSILLALLLLGSLGLGAAAEQVSAYVFDNAGLLSDAEEIKLEGMVLDVMSRYDLHIAIVTANTLEGKSPRRYADEYYNGLFGEYSDGILFLLSMEDRDWYISTSGQAMQLLTDGEVDASAEEILHYLSGGDYYQGFAAWLGRLSYYLEAQAPQPQPNIPLAVLIGLGVALIAILVMRSRMNTKRQQPSARQYLVEGSYNLRIQQDFFLYSNITKTARPKDNGGSSRGSSGGRSHGGGGGKF